MMTALLFTGRYHYNEISNIDEQRSTMMKSRRSDRATRSYYTILILRFTKDGQLLYPIPFLILHTDLARSVV